MAEIKTIPAWISRDGGMSNSCVYLHKEMPEFHVTDDQWDSGWSAGDESFLLVDDCEQVDSFGLQPEELKEVEIVIRDREAPHE